MAEPQIGQLYEFSGKVSFNDKFRCHQIQFAHYRTILPTDAEGIFSYLVDVARWVGPSIAQAIVKEFGSATLEIIKQTPEKVQAMNVKGLTAARLDEMRKSLIDNEALEAATVEVNNLLSGAVGPATVRKAIKKWGCNAATLIRQNPYMLTALPGIGFLSADAVHRKLDGDPQAIARHRAALLHVLGEAAAREGHTLISLTRARLDTGRLVGSLLPAAEDPDNASIIRDDATESIALSDLAGAEHYIAHKLTDMIRYTPDVDEIGFPAIDTDGLAGDQAEAVKAFRPASVFALVGAPGTGKTYTVARIVKSLRDAGRPVLLAAPTGKAAKQMTVALSETCGGEARTIHSLLEPQVDEDSGEFTFTRGEHLPLEAEIVVIDEASMIDVRLFRSLLKALPARCRLLIVGDHYQLPSVGPGAVLRDLLRASLPHVELKEIKRNAGLIVRACHAIKDGRIPRPAERLNLETGDNWRHIEVGDPESIKLVIHTLIGKAIPAL
ncbi:MAG TPA: AAA family ATPase, partial [Phycisphaerae bacterium]|nr:AAA family ATPase [Phycisphaerae bacterium]